MLLSVLWNGIGTSWEFVRNSDPGAPTSDLVHKYFSVGPRNLFHKPSRWFLAFLKPLFRAFFFRTSFFNLFYLFLFIYFCECKFLIVYGILANGRMEVLQVWTRGQGVDSVKGTERHTGCAWRVLEILVWNVLGNTTVEVWLWLWVTEAKCNWKWFLTLQGYEIGLRSPRYR